MSNNVTLNKSQGVLMNDQSTRLWNFTSVVSSHSPHGSPTVQRATISVLCSPYLWIGARVWSGTAVVAHSFAHHRFQIAQSGV